MYRDASGKTKIAGTFQYRFQAQEAADAAEGKLTWTERDEALGMSVLDYSQQWLRRRTAIVAATRNSYRNAIVNQIGPGLWRLTRPSVWPPVTTRSRCFG
jgi:hypothetical protein